MEAPIAKSDDAPSEMEAAFQMVESAIDAHPTLVRIPGLGLLGEPEVVMSRFGVTVRIRVKLGNRRNRPDWIHGEGNSVTAAASNLVNSLDSWAQAIA